MPRPRRASPAGLIFHVINRAAKKTRLFGTNSDYEAFQQVLSFAVSRFDIALFAYSIMPNHWHFVLSSRVDGELSRFMHWLTTTHARRWQLAKGVDGQGAVYQGRFKAIPIETERRRAMGAGQPFGEDEWARMIVGVLGQSPRRPRGRPRKCPQKMTSDPI